VDFSSRVVTKDAVTGNNTMVMKFVVLKPDFVVTENNFHLGETDQLISHKVTYNKNVATITVVAGAIPPNKLNYFHFSLHFVAASGYKKRFDAYMNVELQKPG